MSNDDDSKGLLNFVQKILGKWQENFIITYCPNHLNSNNQGYEAKQILETLSEFCELYFFVQEEKYGNPTAVIKTDKITSLKSYGPLELLKGQHEADFRGEAFLSFIKSYVSIKNS